MKHFSELKGTDDVLIISKCIPMLLASMRCVSYDLTRLITQKSSCGETRHLYLSFPPSVDVRGSAPVADPHIHRPYWSLLLWISGFVTDSDRRRLGPPQPVMVVTRPVFASGPETGTSKDHTNQATVTSITFHVMSPLLFHSLFCPPLSTTFFFSAIVVALPRWALMPPAVWLASLSLAP